MTRLWRVLFQIALVGVVQVGPLVHSLPAQTTKDLNPVSIKAAPQHPTITLVADGQPKAAICVLGGRSRALNEAVANLQMFIEKSTTAKLSIVYDKITPPAIVIGDCDLAKAQGIKATELPIEGFVIKTTADHVLIVGRDVPIVGETIRSDGTANGVLEFIERFVGVRWYYPGELGQSVPQSKSLAVSPVHLEDAPKFRKREIWPAVSKPWTGTGTQLGPLHGFLRSGNSWPVQLVVHSPNWSKIKEYQEQRPEVYQQRSDKTRDHEMLCYGHPRTLETYLENIERHVSGKTPVHMGISGKAVTVSPADAEVACYCDHCRKLWNEKGGQYGSASKIVGKFAADLGREMKRRWPDMTVVYLPYLNYTQAPEGVEFPDNVEIQLCGMPGLAQYKEPAIAKADQENIDRWMKLTGRKVQNWHYSCWPEDRTTACYLFPHTLQQFYLANRDKTVGTFINGTTDHWPRQHVSLYCWLKLLWDPNFDVDAAIEEYCRRMYGPAAGTLRELVGMQIDGWEKSRWPGERISPKGIHEQSFPLASVKKMETLLAQAREQAQSDELVLKRIEYYATPFPEFIQRAREFADGTGIRPLVAQKVGEDPKIDGKLDEPLWQRAAPLEFVLAYDRMGTKPTYPTSMRAVWTFQGITFGFHMNEPTPDRLERKIKGRDDSLAWWDDNVELLFDVTGKNEGEFYHLIVNPNAAVADAKAKDFSRNYDAIQCAAHTGADFWSLEVLVPYAAFTETSKPGSGSNTVWHGNFTRHRVADKGLTPKFQSFPGSQREYQRLNTTFAQPSNNLTDFAPIRFAE